MLTDWLAPRQLPKFLQNHLQRTPYACPETARGAIPLFGWETLDRVLQSNHPLDVLTVAGGQLVDVSIPRCLGDVRRLVDAGVSVVVRASERHDPGLASLAASFNRAVPGEVHILR